MGNSLLVDVTSEMTQRILTEFATITVVGLSSDPVKSAHSVPAAMQASGGRAIPVTPPADPLLGEQVSRRLAAVPEQGDFANVSRPSADAGDIARQAVAVG